MLVTTLDRMARGGIIDQLAGGFHRYSTDEAWLVPHFEKMLYDNAALAWLYAEASALAPSEGFERVARATLDFVLREMTGREGGFFSAIDAETDGHEGAYYTWTATSSTRRSGARRRAVHDVYGIEGPPPFEGERYVLHLPVPLAELARTGGVGEAELLRRLDRGRRALARGAQPPRAAAHRRQGPRRLERPDDRRDRARRRAPRRAALPRRGAPRRRASCSTRWSTARRARCCTPGATATATVPGFLDDYAFLVEGLLRAARGDRRGRSGSTRRCASPTSRRSGSATPRAAASSPRARTRACCSARSRPSTAPSPPATASRR